MLIKKIYGLAACSAILCSSGAVVSFLSSNNPIPEPTKVENLEPVNENKPTEFKLDTYKTSDSLLEFGFFDADDFDLKDINF